MKETSEISWRFLWGNPVGFFKETPAVTSFQEKLKVKFLEHLHNEILYDLIEESLRERYEESLKQLQETLKDQQDDALEEYVEERKKISLEKVSVEYFEKLKEY